MNTKRSLTVRLWTQRILAALGLIAMWVLSDLVGNILPGVCITPVCLWLFLTREVDWDWSVDTPLSRWAEKEVK